MYFPSRFLKMISAPVVRFAALLSDLGLMPADAAEAAGGRLLPNRKARRRAIALARAAGGPGVSVSPYYLDRVDGRRRPDPGRLRARRLAVVRLDGRA
jgi:hypothetical protein